MTLRKFRLLFLFAAFSLGSLFRIQACEVPNPSGASQACEGHTLGTVNGISACMDGSALHICENNFPDEIFRGYMAETFDADGNGKLKNTEIAGVTEIDVSSANPSSLEGIRFFSGLTRLNCGFSRLTDLDVRGCAALSYLYCSWSQLTDLNAGGCTALEELYCQRNRLTQLNISGCSALTHLTCSTNQLTVLDVGGCPALVHLECDSNRLAQLDLSGCPAISEINAASNLLTQVNLSGCSGLDMLNAGSNRLTQLDLSGCPDLLYLGCDSNQLTALDLSGCSGLEHLYCQNNPLTELDISACPKMLLAYNEGEYVESSETVHGWRYGSGTAYALFCDKTLEILTAVPLAITAQPRSASAYVGATAKFTVVATGTGLKYQWQYKYPGESWKNSGYASGKTATLSFAAQAKYNKMQVRCKITDASGKSVTSSAVTLTILPKITAQPASTSAAVGAAAKFTVTATGAGLTYQWQYKYPDGSWTNSGYASGKTATLSFAAQAKYNKMQYRCKITDANGKTITSSAVTLTINPKITAQPKSVSAAVGATAKFTVTATGAGLKYQWQYKYPDGSWTNSGYASGKTASLSFAAQAKYNNVQYRCRITDANGKTLTSSAVKLTIIPKITAQPKSVTAAAGATAKFTVTATGAGLKYQWQYKYPDGSWTNSGYSSAKTATLSVPVQARYNGILYRCVITDANGKTVTSNNAKLTVR